jgi:hypothetical protein
MPLEGHWQRQQTPLARRATARERRALWIVGGVLAVAVAVVVWAIVARGDSPPAAGCIEATAPSTMGAGTLHACGGAAARLCRSQAGRDDPSARSVRASCVRAGYRIE